MWAQDAFAGDNCLAPLGMNEAHEPQFYERVLCEELVYEGEYYRLLNAKKPQPQYNEKTLRDEAAAEVALYQASAATESDSGGGSNSRKRKTLNPDEKLQISRDRNREHAKNTRLRKKAYVVKLKELVDQLVLQKDKEDKDRRAFGMRVYETQTTRKNVVRLLLSYRANNMRERAKWAAILDENVEMTLPITPYRSFPKSSIVGTSRVVSGIDAVIADTASLALMAQGICYGTPQWQAAIKCGQGCRLAYSSSRDDIVAAGEHVMCRFSLRTEGSEQVGALHGCVQHGMLQAHFNGSNKITAVEMMFDVMGFMQQLQRASSISPESSIVPNTVDMALLPSKEVRAIVHATEPFTIVHINEAWTTLYNLPQSKAEGMPLADVILAPKHQSEQMLSLASECAAGKPVSALALVHSRSNASEPALIYIKMFPLTGGLKNITHLLVVHTDLPMLPIEAQAVKQHIASLSTNGAGGGGGADAGANSSSDIGNLENYDSFDF